MVALLNGQVYSDGLNVYMAGFSGEVSAAEGFRLKVPTNGMTKGVFSFSIRWKPTASDDI